MNYVVIDEEGNNAVWDEAAELPKVFYDVGEAYKAAKEQATEVPGNKFYVCEALYYAVATVAKPRVKFVKDKT